MADFLDPLACSLPGSSVHGISQTRILESAAFSFSRDLANPGIKLSSPAASALIVGLLYHGATWETRGSPAVTHKTRDLGCGTFWGCFPDSLSLLARAQSEHMLFPVLTADPPPHYGSLSQPAIISIEMTLSPCY